MYGFKKILVPSDFTEVSTKALGVAISLAVRFKADLYLMYVIPGAPSSKTWMSNKATREQLESLEGDERKLFDEYIRMSRVIEHELGEAPIPRSHLHLRVAGGDVETEILQEPRTTLRSISLVIGSHGRRSIKDHIIGSVSERIHEKSNCAVLSVRAEGYPFLRN